MILLLSVLILLSYLFTNVSSGQSIIPSDEVWHYEDIQKEYSAKKFDTKEEYHFVYDGDTFFVSNKKCMKETPVLCKRIGVRIRGVDTPELHSAKCERERKLALMARGYLRWTLESQEFELRNIDRGSRFRVIADVYIKEGNLLPFLLAKDFYREYSGKSKREPWCSQSEMEAFKRNKK
jgi:endonuclease YncB( thermonuclease family)